MKIPNIEVGIMTSSQLQFRLQGKFSTENEVLQGEYEAKIEAGQIILKNNDKRLVYDSSVLLFPIDIEDTLFELKDVTIGVDFHWQQQENQSFKGALKLHVSEGKLTAINLLSIEDYLISVISSEMRADSSLALLKAHAIISRSWLLAQINKQNDLTESEQAYQSIIETETEYIRWWDREDHDNFHVCADDHCQRYQGVYRTENPNVVKAVQETTGMVLMSDGKIADARFSKCCGGVSELFENCWEPIHHSYLEKVVDTTQAPKGYVLDLEQEENAEKWLTEKPDAFCNTSDPEILNQVLNDYDKSLQNFYRWKVEYTQEELADLIQRRSERDFGQIIDLIPIERGASGRIIRLKIIGSKQTLVIGKELLIRRWLSESHLYSSAFVIEKIGEENTLPEKFILSGGGWGHGVGLCQIGAAVMGHKGYSYEAILKHYFTGATIEKQY